MGMFKWAEEESKGSPLFAGTLAAGAVAATPAADYLRNNVLGPSYQGIERNILDAAGEVSPEQIKALKGYMIDRSIRDKLLIIPEKDTMGAFVKTPKNFLPDRAELEHFIGKGGMRTFEGVADPIKAIQAIRDSGGFVALPKSGSHAVTLAHELGHATSLNAGSAIRNSKPFRYLDTLGRKAIHSGPRGALSAALLAGAFDSEDNTKWVVPGALGLTQAAVLGEEAIASARGINALKALKNTPSSTLAMVGEDAGKLFVPGLLENAGKSLRRAWGTYGLGAAGLLAAPVLAIKAREQWDKSRKN
jgi:hypothetical protein